MFQISGYYLNWILRCSHNSVIAPPMDHRAQSFGCVQIYTCSKEECVCIVFSPVGCWSEEHSYSRRSWERYQREVMKECDEDEDREEYDSD